MKLTNKEGFTKVDNYFLDHVMPRVSGAEWKIVCIVLRGTLGSFKEAEEISIPEFMAMSGYERQAVIQAVQNVLQRGAMERRAQQRGRQRTFLFRSVQKANLKELPPPTPRRQQSALPFDVRQITEFENQTPMTPSDTVENVSPNETKFENQTSIGSLTEFENQTPNQYENQTPIARVLIVDLDRSSEDIKNAVAKTDRDQQPVENTPTESQIVILCRFCQSRHDDPLRSPAVTLYYERFKLMPNEGFRHDIWVTVQNLLLWSDILEGWWYTNNAGRRVDKNPLGIKQMLNVYDEAIRKRDGESQRRA